MPHAKRASKAVEAAQQRAAGLATINPNIDLGNNLTLAAYTAMIADTQTMLDAYNRALAAADTASNALQDAEKELAAHTERMLLAVAAKHGKDSYEYELAGGTRKSERKRPARKPVQML